MFTSVTRCRIPQCDNGGSDPYKHDWLKFTTPSVDGVPSKCTQYQFRGDDNYMEYVNNQCREPYFNQSTVVHCHEYVYKTEPLTILNDFDLACENAWKLTTIGSLKNIAEVVILPITGIISDRFGRKSLLIGSLLLSGISGTVTSFSTNYWMYAIMEFITSMCAAGIYMSVFILGMELVGANKRVLGGTIIAQIFAVGQVILGFVAMNIRNYRHLLRSIYLPTVLVLSYIWYIPESVRWLMSKGQNKKALKIIYQAAKTNRVELSNSTLDSMYEFSDNESDRINKSVVGTVKSNPFLLAIRSRVLIVRFLICCFCWFTNGFVYYGISVHAVTLAGNKYINFMLVSVAEVPAIIITYFLMQNFRRKWSLQLAMLICAVVCITSEFVSDFSPIWKLVLFGIGKCAISIAFTVSRDKKMVCSIAIQNPMLLQQLILNIFERCNIPECDSTPHDDYLPKWTRFAIPHSHNVPAKCLRYNSIFDSHFKSSANHCDEMLFNDSYSVSCTEFIYKTDEVTILKEFNLTCEANEWKLAFVGTVKNVGELLMLPFYGMLSDRLGQKFQTRHNVRTGCCLG
ncbi:hypothetical protein HA402_013603 [Bradysia odoriphaga]|nr:hypothetical protein HA402_013603 [Bradysia odoriphaga]